MGKTMKFAEGLDRKVDMTKVNVDSIKPWIPQRMTELLGMDDDVIVELVYNYLEEPTLDPKEMQINLTGFLNGKNSRLFMGELWEHLCSAQENITGIPTQFLEQKKNEIKLRQEEQDRIKEALKEREE